jgi:uroporphyrin-III C-methyltransferase
LAKTNQDIIEHSASQEDAEIQTPQAVAKTSSAGIFAFIFIAVLISIAAAAFSFFLFQKLEENKAELHGLKLEIGGQLTGKLDGVSGKFNNVSDRFINVSDRISRFSDEISKINSNIKQNDIFVKQEFKQQENLIKQQNSLINQLTAKLQDSELAQGISNEQLTRSLDMLFKQKGKTRNDWILSEVEYLLLIANHGLQLSFDVNTAIIALQSADARLLDMGDPGIINIRKNIAEELIQLKAVPVVDVPGMQLILSGMIKHSTSLPVLDSEIPGVEDLLASVKKPQPAENTSVQEQSTIDQVQLSLVQATDKFLQELKNLVVYRNTKVAATALIAPEQKFFLQQHVSLKLESARKALLDGRNNLFHNLLKETETILKEYFDNTKPSVTTFLEQLTFLRSKNLSRSLPDISFSLKELKKYTQQLELHRTSANAISQQQQETN